MFPHSLFPITRCLSRLSSLLGLACALLLMLAACEPIELPTDDNGSGSGGSSSGGGGSVAVDTVSVAEFMESEYDQQLCVVGYIVGYVNGTRMSSTRFELPEKANTNLVLSDEKYPSDLEGCLPVQIPTTNGLRAALNLYAHPELLGAKVALVGVPQSYMGVIGLKKLVRYTLLQDADEDEDNEEEEPGDEHPDDTFLRLRHTVEFVEEGR